jgi:hypothetical protein
MQVNTPFSLSQLQFLFFPTVYGDPTDPVLVVAAAGITSHLHTKTIIFLAGSGPVDDILANPQISPGGVIGQELVLIGTSDSDYVFLTNDDGLDLQGDCLVNTQQVLSLIWDGTNWREQYRRN